MHFPEDAPRAYASDELEQHLRALALTATSLARDIDSDTMLSYALRASACGCHASRALIMAVDAGDQSLRGIAPAFGLSDADALATRVGADECVATDAALQHGISTIAPSLTESTGLPAIAVALGARNCLVAPVTAGKDVIGILYLFDKNLAYGGFNTLDLAFVRTTVSLLGSALVGKRVLDRAPSSVVGNDSGLVPQPRFEQTMSLEMERAQRLGLALACATLEVSNYAHIVEMHGSQAADIVVQHIGQTLAKHVRQIDILLRYDDERIVLLMPGTAANVASTVVRRLEAHLARISWPKVGKIDLRCGISSYPEDVTSANELVSTALKNAAALGDAA